MSTAAFGERLAFERLLAELSARFANVARDGVIAEIEAALARLVESLGYDRCTYTELAASGELALGLTFPPSGTAVKPRSAGTPAGYA